METAELDATLSPSDYPRGYKVEVSNDKYTWSKPIAEGKGTGPVTRIKFPPTQAKFIRITQTGSSRHHFWSINEF